MQLLTLIVFSCCMHQTLSGSYYRTPHPSPPPPCTASTPLPQCNCNSNGGCPYTKSQCVSGKCACVPGYVLKGNTCVKANVGSDCGAQHNKKACEGRPLLKCSSSLHKCTCVSGATRSLFGLGGCICESGKVMNSQKDGCKPAKVGDSCTGENRRACLGLSAQCKQGTCQCKFGLVAKPNRSGCIANICTVNEPIATCSCTKDQHCKHPNSECIMTKCVCKATFTLKGNSCVSAEVGDSCSGPTSLRACDGLQGSSCQGGTCKCNSGLVKATDGDSCIQPTPVCGAGKTLSGDRRSCVTAQIGSNCGGVFAPQACVNIGFAQCSGGKCLCRNTFESSGGRCICPARKTLNGSQCKLAEVGDSCSGPTSLRACSGLQGSSCKGGTCKCNSGLVKATDGDSCIQPTPVCGPGKTLSGDRRSCVTAQIGSNCGGVFAPQACVNLGFAQCSGGKCLCRNTFESSGGHCICPARKTLRGSQCKQAEVGDSCSGPTSLRACSGLQGSSCKGGTCKCNAGLVRATDGNSCTQLICGPGQTVSEDRLSCVTAEIGSACGGISSPQACVNLDFAECRAGECECKNTFEFSRSGGVCVCLPGLTNRGEVCESAEVGDSCSGPTSLRACSGLQGSSCKGGTCKCNSGLVKAPDSNSCAQLICGPGQTLSEDRLSCVTAEIGSVCGGTFAPQACVNIGFAQCTAGKCKCKNTFETSGGRCICPAKKTLKGEKCKLAQVNDFCGSRAERACVNLSNTECTMNKCKCKSGFNLVGNSCMSRGYY